ncbi:uncharacterized protein [Dysidea avara]|uniref:uncharacterized protein isoform X2 n=1 Tax=Dysidea avara TaxID=196820 RepID=UPI0033202356
MHRMDCRIVDDGIAAMMCSGELCDNVISQYLKLLKEEASKKGKHCEVLSTFTLGKLEREGAKSLECWFKKMRNLLECDLVVVPSMKVMTYYDSIWRSTDELFNKCRNILEASQATVDDVAIEWNSWNFFVAQDIPSQTSNDDCGNDMKEIRYTMAVELQQNSLLNQKGSVFFDGNDAITSECDVADVPPDEDLNISTPSNLSPVNSDLLLFTQGEALASEEIGCFVSDPHHVKCEKPSMDLSNQPYEELDASMENSLTITDKQSKFDVVT